METDCTWCGSAQSIEHGVCQVCLMRFPEPTGPDPKVVVVLDDELGVEEAAAERRTGTSSA